jgi:L-serine dehydratase
LIFQKGKRLPYHSNAIRFRAYDKVKNQLTNELYYSVGGGFIVRHEHAQHSGANEIVDLMPYPFSTCEELLAHCKENSMMIYDIVMENEKALRNEAQVRQGIFRIWQVMQDCVERGFHQEGTLPGGLEVKRRAPEIYEQLMRSADVNDPTEFMDWVSLFALAVNEENAAGGRVVTAPTNGAAGVIPAVLHYYLHFTPNPNDEGIIRFFLTATAIGTLYKIGASLSAAEMGCQGEIGVACSMAAGGLTAAIGGTNEQIENAAEIGMEHNLGLTCDPIAGLVQIPCIERNTMGAIKAINASKLAMRGDGTHRVSLDQVILAMRQTGEDMKSTYKETSEAGLAAHVPVSVPEC